MTDRLPILREALIHAETQHAGLQHLRHQLGSAVGASAMEAADAVGELVRRLRDAVTELEGLERLDAELRELGIDPDELDAEDVPWPLPPCVVIRAFDMVLPAPAPRPDRRLSAVLWPAFTPRGSARPVALQAPCYRTASGMPVHTRPGCRC